MPCFFKIGQKSKHGAPHDAAFVKMFVSPAELIKCVLILVGPLRTSSNKWVAWNVRGVKINAFV